MKKRQVNQEIQLQLQVLDGYISDLKDALKGIQNELFSLVDTEQKARILQISIQIWRKTNALETAFNIREEENWST